MASLNKVMLIGNLGADPEMRYLPSGEAVANIRIATTDTWKDKDGNKIHTRPDPEKFVPTKVRFTMVQVAAGATYNPNLVPNIPHTN